MTNKTFDFTTLYLAISIVCENKYLTYLNPATRDLSLFFCGRMEEIPGVLSYEEVVQKAKMLIDSTFVMPSTIITEVSAITVLNQTTDRNGNMLLCLMFAPDVGIGDALAITPKEGHPNYISFMRLDAVRDWEPKNKYTEKLLQFLG